jgi:hypothetical protein
MLERIEKIKFILKEFVIDTKVFEETASQLGLEIQYARLEELDSLKESVLEKIQTALEIIAILSIGENDPPRKIFHLIDSNIELYGKNAENLPKIQVVYRQLLSKFHPDKCVNLSLENKYTTITSKINAARDNVFNPSGKNATPEQQDVGLETSIPRSTAEIFHTLREKHQNVVKYISDGNLEAVKKLLMTHPYIIDKLDVIKEKHFIFNAIETHQLEILEFLLESYVKNINEIEYIYTDYLRGGEKHRFSPLYIACIEGSPIQIIKTLVHHGANINNGHHADKTKKHRSPLLAAIDFDETRGMSKRRLTSSITVIPEVIEFLIKKGARIDEECEKLFIYPLMNYLIYYIEYHFMNVEGLDVAFLILLRHGADIQQKIREKSELKSREKTIFDQINSALKSKPCFGENLEQYIQDLKHLKNSLYCRQSFDAAKKLIQENKIGYESYLVQAGKYNFELFKQLLLDLVNKENQFKEIDLDENQKNYLFSLDIVRSTIDKSIFFEKIKIENQGEKNNLLIFYNHQVVPIETLDDGLNDELKENLSSQEKKDILIEKYKVLLVLKKNELDELNTLIDGRKVKKEFINKNTLWAANQANQVIEKALSICEERLRKNNDIGIGATLAPFAPIANNLRFFRKYIVSSLSGEVNHHITRIAYCRQFLRDLGSRVVVMETKTQPSTHLLKHLYFLKGMLLTEVHRQTFLDNLFRCAMTSRLCDHVENEIKKIEKMLRSSTGANIDDPASEIGVIRNRLIPLEEAYGTTWNRFKTVFLRRHGKVDVDQEFSQKQQAALSNINFNT